MKTPKNTSWNLLNLYKSHQDPQIEKDTQSIEKAYAAFAQKYSNKEYLKNNQTLLQALTEWEKLREESDIPKPILYFFLAKDINSTDEHAEKMIQSLISRLTNAGNQAIFFPLSLAKIEEKNQKKLLQDASLKKYHYYLSKIFEEAKYTLTEPEEKIMNLKSQPAHSMWVEATEKMLAGTTVKWKGKDTPISKARFELGNLPKNDRRKLHDLVVKALKEKAPLAEAEMNAVLTNKKIDDELRGYQTPFQATVMGNQNDPAAISNLVASVRKYYHLSHRFYKLKARLLKEKTLTYADRDAGVPKKKPIKYSFEKSVEIIKEAFNSVSPFYRETFERYLSEGRIDSHPKKGKRGGAYCLSSRYGTYVLLNHADGEDGIMTIGHEMGHAFHGELSGKSQPHIYYSYSTSIAETASTLFENFVFEVIFERLNDHDKMIALHDRLNDDINTIFRQIAGFTFEERLHAEARKNGYLSAKEMGAIHNKAMSEYLGPLVKLTEYDGYSFVSWLHIRNFFYVYTYAYGQLVSKILYRKYKQDKKFIKNIEQVLSAGGSDTPENILKHAGIDVTKPEFFEEGLKSIEEDLNKLESLLTKK